MVGDAGLSGFPESTLGDTDQLSEEAQRTTGAASDLDADGRSAETDGAAGADGRTGWEKERAAFLALQNQTAHTMSAGPGQSDMDIPADVLGGVVSAMVVLPQCLDDTPIRAYTASQTHTDRKAMRKQREKKIALGHAEDEKTVQFDFQMNM